MLAASAESRICIRHVALSLCPFVPHACMLLQARHPTPSSRSSRGWDSVTWDDVDLEGDLKEWLRTVVGLKASLAWRLDKLLGWVRWSTAGVLMMHAIG